MQIRMQHIDTVCEVALSGRFTFSDQLAFSEVLQQLESPQVQRAVLNLAALEFIDSAALGMLLLALEKAEKHEKTLILRGATGQVKKMFGMANFHTLFVLEEAVD